MSFYQEASTLILGMGEVMDNPRMSKFAVKWMVITTHQSLIKQLVTPKTAIGIYSELMRHRPGIAAVVNLLDTEGAFCNEGLDIFEVDAVCDKAKSMLARHKTHGDEMKLEAEVDRAFDLMQKMTGKLVEVECQNPYTGYEFMSWVTPSQYEVN